MKSFNRNLKSLDNKTGRQIKSQIKEILRNKEHYAKCYFWTPRGNAAQRRQEEFEIDFSFVLDGKKYEISQSLSISCRNFYFSTEILVDGEKKNITALKKLV